MFLIIKAAHRMEPADLGCYSALCRIKIWLAADTGFWDKPIGDLIGKAYQQPDI
jgi:hypothetical protein